MSLFKPKAVESNCLVQEFCDQLSINHSFVLRSLLRKTCVGSNFCSTRSRMQPGICARSHCSLVPRFLGSGDKFGNVQNCHGYHKTRMLNTHPSKLRQDITSLGRKQNTDLKNQASPLPKKATTSQPNNRNNGKGREAWWMLRMSDKGCSFSRCLFSITGG